MAIFCSRRASARSFSMCLNSSCVVEPTTRSWPVVRIGLISVAEIHRAAGGRAGADRRVDLVDEEDRHRPLGQRRDDRLEALLEVAAEARAGEQRRRVEREDLGALRAAPARRRRAAAWRAPRRARSCRRRRRRRTPGCSCGAGRGSRSCAAARRARPISGSSSPARRARSGSSRRRRADRATVAAPRFADAGVGVARRAPRRRLPAPPAAPC